MRIVCIKKHPLKATPIALIFPIHDIVCISFKQPNVFLHLVATSWSDGINADLMNGDFVHGRRPIENNRLQSRLSNLRVCGAKIKNCGNMQF